KDGLALTFDVFSPANANGAAVLNMISGGWRSSWRPPEGAARRYSALLEKGFTVFAVRHGSSPKYYIPEIVADVRRAVRFIRHTAADYGIDESRMGVWGGSAGGHLSLVLATASDEGDPSARDEVLRESDRVAAVVAYYPPVDLRRMARGENPTEGNTRFPALNFSRDLASDFSPIVHVSPDDPPALMIHGDEDDLVPISNSEIIHKAFQENNVTSEFITIKGAGHGFRNPEDRELALNALVAWFVDHLTETTK
ncbi:alpha/beta hydrolase, partial [Candidatus Sumerlaeota bacterium]|nr:alpha/beta hydrolase [Candidatus Sumerlaeota bacterium]